MNIPEGFEPESVETRFIQAGDTIYCKDGHFRTVCNKDIKTGGFCGTTIFGDAYLWNRRIVTRIHPKNRR